MDSGIVGIKVQRRGGVPQRTRAKCKEGLGSLNSVQLNLKLNTDQNIWPFDLYKRPLFIFPIT